MNLQYARWMSDAACAEIGGDVWFPEPGGDPNPARRVCGGCDVRAQCFAYALEIHPVAGIWAGTSLHERVQMMRGAA